MESVIHYADSTHKCRSQILLAYFGETNTFRCNHCDVCLEENKKTLHIDEFENISRQIKELLAMHPMQLANLVNAVTVGNEDKRIRTIQWLLDNNQLKYDDENIMIVKS
jgi:ATP-dependent DNA helicase RecQ